MPYKMPKQCAAPGCAGITYTGRYCSKHTGASAPVYKRHERPRTTRQRRGYDKYWYRLRARILRKEPLCRHCEIAGRHTLATEVDHIVPLRAGGTHDDHNLQPLCKSCHSRKTATETNERRAAEDNAG